MAGLRSFTGLLGAVGAAALSMPHGACAAAETDGTTDLGAYRFRYRVAGTGEAVPVQVFDDGRSTYFQFASLSRVPQIVAYDESRQASVPQARVQSPYVVVAGVSPRYELSAAAGGDSGRAVVDTLQGAHVSLASPSSSSRGAAPIDAASAAVADAAARAPDAAHADLRAQARAVYARALAQHDLEAQRLVQEALRLLEQKRPSRESGAGVPAAASQVPKELSHVVLPNAVVTPTAPVAPPPVSGSAASGRGGAGRYPTVAWLAQSGAQRLAIGSAPFVATEPVRRQVAPMRDEVPPPRPAAAPQSMRVAAVPDEGAARDRASAQAAPVPSAPTAAAVTQSLVFEGAAGQRVSDALRAFLGRHGWQMEWETEGDFTIRRGYEIRGASVEDVLVAVLGDYQLSAVVYRGNRVVAIAGNEPGGR